MTSTERNRQRLTLILTAFLALLASCALGTEKATDTSSPSNPEGRPLTPNTPFPSPNPALDPPPVAPAAPLSAVSVIPSTTTTAETAVPGWTRHVSINEVRDLAYGPDGSLWAVTRGGLVRWDLTSDTYSRYQLTARDIAAAPDGTLWAGTAFGLCHFMPAEQSGDKESNCHNYTTRDGLIDNSVRAVAVDRANQVWIGTDKGISRFDGQSWTNYPSPAPTADLALGTNGEVWHATHAGIGRYSPTEDTWRTYTTESGLPETNAQVVATGPDGQVWAYIPWQGMFRLTDPGAEEDEIWLRVDEAPGGLIGDISFSVDGTPWAATIGSLHYRGGSLAFHDGEAWIATTSESGLTPFGALASGPDGQMAASTSQGLAVYDTGEWRLLRDGPAHDEATSIAVTPDGAVWFAFGDSSIASPGGGLSRFGLHRDGAGVEREWTYHIGDAEVTSLALAPDGALWAAAGQTVQRYDGTKWQTAAECSQHNTCGVLDIAFTAGGDVWLANGLSLTRLSSPTGAWDGSPLHTRYEKMVHSLFAAPDGALWMNGWAGTQGSSFVARTDGENWTISKTADAFPGLFAVEAISKDGRIWGVVPEIGLASFNGASDARNPQAPDNTAGINEIASWSDAESWSIYPPPDGISLLSVRTVAPDGALWITTDSGIARFDPLVDSTAATESVPEKNWTSYRYPKRLTGLYGAVVFERDGKRMWIGTTRFEPKVDATGSSLMEATPEGDARCLQEWERMAADLSSEWQATIGSAAINGLHSSSSSVMGECTADSNKATVFTPESTWFFVGLALEGNDYDQIGDSLAECLEILVEGFREQDLPGAAAVIYGTLSTYHTDAAGWPGEWVHYFSLSYEDAQTASEAGFRGRALLDALQINTPVGTP